MRRVVVHKKQRGKRRSRYQLINWAFSILPRLNKSNSVERHKTVDKHLGELLDRYSAIRVAEVMRIWCRFCRIDKPISLTNFERFDSRCYHIVVRKEFAENKTDKKPFFLYAKNKVEFLTRVSIERPNSQQLIREYLKTTLGYSQISEAEYVELQRAIDNHLRELRFNTQIANTTFNIDEWRLKRPGGVLDRIYGTDLPE